MNNIDHFTQGFPNSDKGCNRDSEVLVEKTFLLNVDPGEYIFWKFEPFLKLRTKYCKYWTLIKMKISITFIYKVHEIKLEMVQEQNISCYLVVT